MLDSVAPGMNEKRGIEIGYTTWTVPMSWLMYVRVRLRCPNPYVHYLQMYVRSP
jgi:hypothetical protein